MTRVGALVYYWLMLSILAVKGTTHYILSFAGFERRSAVSRFPTISVHRTAGIELNETSLVRLFTTSTPNGTTLVVLRRASPVVAISFPSSFGRARLGVFDVQILGTFSACSGAKLGQIARVVGQTTRGAGLA